MVEGNRAKDEVMWECEVPWRKAKLGGTSECRVVAYNKGDVEMKRSK